MADNTPQTGSDTMRTKDRTTAKTTIVGIDLGIGTGTEVLMSGSLPVSGTVSVAPLGSTCAVTSVNTSGTANTNSTLLAADSTRDGLFIFNAGTGLVKIAFTTTSSTTVYSIALPPGTGLEVPTWLAQYQVNGNCNVVSNPVNFTAVT